MGTGKACCVTDSSTGARVLQGGVGGGRIRRAEAARGSGLATLAFKVKMEHDGETVEVEVDEDEYILDAVENAGIEVPYDCRMGVCMQCPARLVSGEVDQSEGMISDDVAEKGFVLMCVAKCQSDVSIETVTEDELLDEQLVTSQ